MFPVFSRKNKLSCNIVDIQLKDLLLVHQCVMYLRDGPRACNLYVNSPRVKSRMGFSWFFTSSNVNQHLFMLSQVKHLVPGRHWSPRERQHLVPMS